MSKKVVYTELVTLSFWGFLVHQRFGLLTGFTSGIAAGMLLSMALR